MTVANLYPDINPSLLLDFANVKALDPSITFTRASSAVYYDGVTHAKAEENLLIESQDYSVSWTVENLTPVTGKTAPDTTASATEFTAGTGNATLTQSVTLIAADYTFSVWLRRVTGTGNVDISAHSGGTWVTQTLTGTWTRFSVTQTLTAGAQTPGVRVVTSGDVIEIWGAQLEQRATITAYTLTTTQPIIKYQPVLQTAANNRARFDHVPATGESLGLLIEEQRTNLALRSEEFDLWSSNPEPNFSSVLVNQQTAPDGTITADLIIPSTQTGSKFRFRTFAGALSTTYCASVYVKAAGYNFAFIQLSNTAFGANAKIVIVDLINGVITSQTANASGTIQSVGNGWYRISVVATSLATTGSYVVSVGVSPDGITQIMSGDGYSGILVWGAQVEAGAFPTSYIKTEASQVTRLPDTARMTGVNFSSWFEQDEGSLYVEVTPRHTGLQYVAIIGNNVSLTLGIGYFTQSNTLFARVRGPGGSSSIGSGVAIVANTPFSAMLSYAALNHAWAYNGVIRATGNTNIKPEDSVDLRIGASPLGTLFMTGTIKKIAYYPQRLLDTQLQALTNP